MVVIDGWAANFQAPGPNVPMIATGSPLAAETTVVEPGAPRISTSPPARAPIAALPAAITTKLTCRPCFSNSPASLAIQSGIRLPVTEAYDAFNVSSGCANESFEKTSNKRPVQKKILWNLERKCSG